MKNEEILKRLLTLEAQAEAIKYSAKELRSKLEETVKPVKQKDKDMAAMLSKLTANRMKVYNRKD